MRQVHVSEAIRGASTIRCRSCRAFLSRRAFQQVAHLIPATVPPILETPVAEEEIEAEMERVREALPLGRETMAA